MRALLNLRRTTSEHCDALKQGLERIGDPEVLVTWNRIGHGDTMARSHEARGIPVIVIENAAWGNGFLGRHWFSLARSFHNTAGKFPVGGAERWDGLAVDLAPWRKGGETVVLPQRGIGPPEVAMPRGWTAPGRVRPHPGTREALPLEHDLKNAGRVVTWGSRAAIQALMWGIPVDSHMPNWIAEQDNTEEGRLAMFRRLAWAQWTVEEIATGEPLKRFLS